MFSWVGLTYDIYAGMPPIVTPIPSSEVGAIELREVDGGTGRGHGVGELILDQRCSSRQQRS